MNESIYTNPIYKDDCLYKNTGVHYKSLEKDHISPVRAGRGNCCEEACSKSNSVANRRLFMCPLLGLLENETFLRRLARRPSLMESANDPLLSLFPSNFAFHHYLCRCPAEEVGERIGRPNRHKRFIPKSGQAVTSHGRFLAPRLDRDRKSWSTAQAHRGVKSIFESEHFLYACESGGVCRRYITLAGSSDTPQEYRAGHPTCVLEWPPTRNRPR
ncbi:hypothetical protein TNIN_208091 [Trichonephila inaurata madagascariensis]|uniref:Uncharacterized protein n=1 Tax=Trichonephila inaurata madagascariensis TaxID=2747483 RepID=A0A8X6XB46_9ARAC|nr:hypothetical protein TNIN_208091 [Trichonephila inaurata madagascariensis]